LRDIFLLQIRESPCYHMVREKTKEKVKG